MSESENYHVCEYCGRKVPAGTSHACGRGKGTSAVREDCTVEMTKQDKCPKCGSPKSVRRTYDRMYIHPVGASQDGIVVYACGRSDRDEDTLDCLSRQLAQEREENARLRAIVKQLVEAIEDFPCGCAWLDEYGQRRASAPCRLCQARAVAEAAKENP
jgi:ribosomal protein L24E